MQFSWPLQGANSAGLPGSSSALHLWLRSCLWWLVLPSQLTPICSRSFSCGTGLRALTVYLKIPDWPHRLGSNFARITAGLGAHRSQLAHLDGSSMGNAKLHWILTSRMGSQHLPVEEGHHLNQPRASCVCNLCNTGALGDERHMLLECPALADLSLQFSSLLLSCSSVIALMSQCPTQTLFHPISLAGCQG